MTFSTQTGSLPEPAVRRYQLRQRRKFRLALIFLVLSVIGAFCFWHPSILQSKGSHDIEKMYLSLFQHMVLNDIYEPEPYKNDGHHWKPEDRMLTMIGKRRLDNFELLLRAVVKAEIPGDIIETGVWRGGASFYAAAVLVTLGQLGPRRVFLCDSFSGIPQANSPGQNRGMDKEAHLLQTEVGVSEQLVLSTGLALGLPLGVDVDSIVRLVPGFFNVSLTKLTAEHTDLTFSVVRLDGDTYFSTMESLEALYSRLNIGGFVIIDDYLDWHTCREAVEDFRSLKGIADPIVIIEHRKGDILRGVYWRKSSHPCELFDGATSLLQLTDHVETDMYNWPVDHSNFTNRLHRCVNQKMT